MARRGFFAELQHQAKVAAREAERAQAARARQQAAAARSAQQAQRAAQRAATQAQRAAAADRKRLEKEAREAHVAAMQATVDERNAGLETTYEEIDSLLAATSRSTTSSTWNSFAALRSIPPSIGLSSRPRSRHRRPSPSRPSLSAWSLLLRLGCSARRRSMPRRSPPPRPATNTRTRPGWRRWRRCRPAGRRL
jgi:hypothetical protein